MLNLERKKTATLAFVFLTLAFAQVTRAQTEPLNLAWKPREDLNIILPPSVRIFETNGLLTDGAKVRAMYATVDLRDKNLKLRAVGSNTRRETTLESYHRNNAIFAINGGYFSSTKSESLLVSDGELIAPGPTNFTRGAFGLMNGKPGIVWPFATDSLKEIFHFSNPVDLKRDQTLKSKNNTFWHPSQAVGAGPVLIKSGKIRDTSLEEGFGASHLARHPRSAIGYINEYILIMMVVDGRQQSSAGATIKELAQMMYDVGCFEAVNLDGGGSSAMIAADEVVNVPADIPNGNRHSLRRNASALVLTEEISSPERKQILIDTDSEDYVEYGVWKSSNQVNYYGESASREAVANNTNKSIYSFANIKPDSFQLAAWWTIDSNNTNKAKYIFHHQGSADTLKADQASYSSNGRWNVLGRFFISNGDYLEVIASDKNKKLVTDAIRLVSLNSPGLQPPRGDLRIAVISDLNSGLGSAIYEWQVDSIMQRIPRQWRPDLVICGGDMVAGMGVSDTATLQKMWAGFDKHIVSPLRKNKLPFAFTIGNHDGLRSYPAEREALSEYWTDPAHQTGLEFLDQSHFPHFYSFRSGNTFFISWDASSSEITEENLAWVNAQLESKGAKNAKMRMVIGHLPIYSVAQERDSKGNVLENADALRKLLEKHNVKVYISGHQHAYYPGKRGGLQLLNCGAAGSGPRRWLSTDRQPVNTITIMDVFYQKDTIVYTTFDIKHRDASDMTAFDHKQLPSSINGVNGLLIRNDITVVQKAIGKFFPASNTDDTKDFGFVEAIIDRNTIAVKGTFNLPDKIANTKGSITLNTGKNTEDGEPMLSLAVKTKNKKVGTFSASLELTDGMTENLSVGGYYVDIKTETQRIYRAQLYPIQNTSPDKPQILSHNSRNVYGIRDSRGLYQFNWTACRDLDGDNVSYLYQLAADSTFKKIIFQQFTGRTTFVKRSERDLYRLMKDLGLGQIAKWHHRVIASDGLHQNVGTPQVVSFVKTQEAPTDLIEVEPEPFRFNGKIDVATGQGSGAVWDASGKLWLADYGGSLHIKTNDGRDASFSPLHEVTINNKTYSLKPINGIGLDLDGNILLGINRYLIKVDAHTGKGVAMWEVPEGKRAITTPRVNTKGEIYAMSLFAEDPNYVLKQSTTSPGTFELVRTITLPQRILARTFDMAADGLTLYFPDPGSPIIQKFVSTDGITYKRDENISSTAAGCNAIKILDKKLFATVRASGISGSTLHLRDENQKLMWTLPLNELDGAEARGMTISPDGNTIIICVWDKGGGFYRYTK